MTSEARHSYWPSVQENHLCLIWSFNHYPNALRRETMQFLQSLEIRADESQNGNEAIENNWESSEAGISSPASTNADLHAHLLVDLSLARDVGRHDHCQLLFSDRRSERH